MFSAPLSQLSTVQPLLYPWFALCWSHEMLDYEEAAHLPNGRLRRHPPLRDQMAGAGKVAQFGSCGSPFCSSTRSGGEPIAGLRFLRSSSRKTWRAIGDFWRWAGAREPLGYHPTAPGPTPDPRREARISLGKSELPFGRPTSVATHFSRPMDDTQATPLTGLHTRGK